MRLIKVLMALVSSSFLISCTHVQKDATFNLESLQSGDMIFAGVFREGGLWTFNDINEYSHLANESLLSYNKKLPLNQGSIVVEQLQEADAEQISHTLSRNGSGDNDVWRKLSSMANSHRYILLSYITSDQVDFYAIQEGQEYRTAAPSRDTDYSFFAERQMVIQSDIYDTLLKNVVWSSTIESTHKKSKVIYARPNGTFIQEVAVDLVEDLFNVNQHDLPAASSQEIIRCAFFDLAKTLPGSGFNFADACTG